MLFHRKDLERRRRMTTAEHSTVVGVFQDRTRAEHALDELRQAGFSDDQIGYSPRDDELKKEGKEGGEPGTEHQAAPVGPVVVVVRAENRLEEASNILERNGADNVSSHAQATRDATAEVSGREYDPILGPQLVGEEDILPLDYSGFGLTRDPALDTEPATASEYIPPDKETQEQAGQLGSADTGSWKDPKVKNPSIQ
jgi:hypothetical protein